jgi:hypothetical protein
LLRKRALKYLAENPDSWKGMSHSRHAVALALLTSKDAKQQALGKRLVLGWNNPPGPGTWTWNLSYQLITLCEYQLLTGDTSARQTIQTTANALRQAQYKGKISVWDPKHHKEDYEKIDAAQQLYLGGFGHAPYQAGVGKNGYGPMQFTTILAVIAWQLAERCGAKVDPEGLKSAMAFIDHGTNEAGYVAYGGEFTLNNGLVDPVRWKKSTRGSNYVGRVGASVIAHKLSLEIPGAADRLDKNMRYMQRAYKSLTDGHACSILGFSWGLLGAAASEDESLMRTIFDYHKAWFNMMRCHDGSFVVLPGRDYADGSYYRSSRYHPTGVMALVLGLGDPKLLIQGTQVTIPGVNPKALTGALKDTYKAIVEKEYGKAVRALKRAGKGDAAADALAGYLAAQSQHAVTELDALEKTGDIVRLNAQLKKVRSDYGELEGFPEKIARFEEGMRQDPWKTELKLGAHYQQLVGALKRNKTMAYVGDLERFAERHPESLYGKWALIVAKAYRDDRRLVDPSVASAAATARVTPTSADGGVRAAKPATKPAARPPAKPKPAAVSAEALKEWQSRFVKKLDALAKGGRKVRLDLGDRETYMVRGANDTTLTVRTQGNDLPMPWRMLSASCRAALAKSAAQEDDVEALLIAAVLHLACGKRDEADLLFAKAALEDAEAVKTARAKLASP